MKNLLYILLIFVGYAQQVHAAILTVDNNTNSAGQYTSLQNAINAANAGDTLYISGSVSSYGSVSLNKRLTLIGTGYNPAKQNPLVSSTATIALDTVNSISGASGSRIIGLNSGSLNDNYGAKNILIERNAFNGVSSSLVANSSGFIYRNNVFNSGNVYLNGASNVLYENNIMYNGAFHYSGQPSVVINHNLFMNNIGSGSYGLYQLSFATITNNIFWGTTPLGANMTNNTFNNNLTFQTSNDVIPGSNNSGAGNLVATNPQFINAPSPGISYSYNYNVSNASAANNAGTDGTDIGVYGGVNFFPDLTGMPAIPQMVEMLITNPVVTPAGNLNVTFKAKKHD